MASGSSGRANSGAKGFDFATDDILCSYEDYGNQDSSNGSHSDPGVGTNSSKDFQKSRLARPTMYSSPSYSQPDDSLNQDIIAIVDKNMKKHVDGIMRFLEGISSRLSQLELYCYNLDKSIGEMRSDLTRDQSDADTKLKSLDKHIQEVHRSVQILRDKQELADTQKELAKLQLAQKETSTVNSQNGDDKSSAPASDSKKPDISPDASNNQLALALPHQVPQQHQPAPAPPQNVPQQQTYYMQPTQVPNPSGPTQIPPMQYLAADPQGRVPPQTAQPQVNQTQNMPQYHPQYQQQWSQQQVQVQPPPQQSSLPPQMRNQATPGYPPYPATNPPSQETIPNSIPMQMQYSGVPPQVSSRADTVPYGYGGPTRVLQQQPPSQPQKGAFGPPPGEGYAPPGVPQSIPQGSGGYMVYEAEGGRPHHPPQLPPQQQAHYSQGGYPPNVPVQNPPSNLVGRNPSQPQFVRNHPYGELIEKLVSMGFRGDHAANVIQRMEENGQQVDFNGVLDRLNGHPPSAQRGWSG